MSVHQRRRLSCRQYALSVVILCWWTITLVHGSWTYNDFLRNNVPEVRTLRNGTQVNMTEPQYEGEEYWFLSKLLENYDKRAHPTFQTPGTPTVVTVDIYIRSFGSISAVDMEFSVDVYMRQSWNDPRLNQTFYPYDFRVTEPAEVVKFWRPDTYFPDAKKSTYHDVTTQNWGMIISPNGTILFSTRLTMTFSCSMNLRSFPFDVQLCYIELGTYWYTTDQVVMNWKSSKPVQGQPGMKLAQFEIEAIQARQAAGSYESDYTPTTDLLYEWSSSDEPVTWYDRISIPQFDLLHPTRTRHGKHDLVAGSYSVLIAEIVLERQFGYHLVQTFLPSVMIVTISWVSFWLDVDAIPARTTLGVTTLLTITTQSAGVRTTLPPVSYAKAIDIWLGACTFFVFASLLEFILVNYVSRKTPRRIQRRKTIFRPTQEPTQEPTQVTTPHTQNNETIKEDRWMDIELNADTMKPKTGDSLSESQQAYIRSYVMRHQRMARRMDSWARILLPLAYIGFNAFYWPYYLVNRKPIE